MAGVDATGFVPKTLDELKSEMEAELKGIFGESIDVSPESVFGQLIGVMADRYAELWEVSEDVHKSSQPDNAVGTDLDEVCAITGTVRNAATASEVVAVCVGTNGTLLVADRQASVVNTNTRFSLDASITLATIAAWTGSTLYAAQQLAVNDGGKLYFVVTTGTSAASGGPTGTGLDIIDGTVHWRYIATAPSAAVGNFTATDTGPLLANAGTLTVIETPVSGWNSIVNPLDASPGQNLESDADLRARRENEIRRIGSSSVEAIRQDILDVEDVTNCIVFENVLDVPDVDGIPPHAVEVLAIGGADQDIREALFDSVAAGIRTYGNISGNVVDAFGYSHTIQFSRVTLVDIYVVINILAEQAKWPVDGVLQVKNKIKAFGDLQPPGKNVVSSSIASQAFDVSGVLDTSPCFIGTTPAPVTSTTIAIAPRQLAVFDTSRITVNVTFGVP